MPEFTARQEKSIRLSPTGAEVAVTILTMR